MDLDKEPTIIKAATGSVLYKVDGLLHRNDGPAITTREGAMGWYQHGNRHRTDGPAIIYKNGKELYYLNDIKITKEAFELKMTLKDHGLEELL